MPLGAIEARCLLTRGTWYSYPGKESDIGRTEEKLWLLFPYCMGSLPNSASQCNSANSLPPCRHMKRFVKVMMHLTRKKELQFLLSFESLGIEFVFFALLEFTKLLL